MNGGWTIGIGCLDRDTARLTRGLPLAIRWRSGHEAFTGRGTHSAAENPSAHVRALVEESDIEVEVKPLDGALPSSSQTGC